MKDQINEIGVPARDPACATANREYKSTVFSLLYEDKKALLSLYNGMNHSQYTDPDGLEIVTLTDAVYIGMKNDKAFLLDCRLHMYEHQSTWNPNMPLRNLYYVAREYGKMVDTAVVYRSRAVKIPNPRFIVFYNGQQKQPERQILKLSDLYIYEEEDPMLELKVEVLNINEGYNDELKESCESLRHYCIFVEKVRENMTRMKELNKAIDKAVDECIVEGVLRDFLIANRAEVVALSILEFTFEDWLEVQELERKEFREEMEKAQKKVKELKDEANKIKDEANKIKDEASKMKDEANKIRDEANKMKDEAEKEKEEAYEEGLKVLVTSLSSLFPGFEEVYQAVVSNRIYADCTREQVEKYYEKK